MFKSASISIAVASTLLLAGTLGARSTAAQEATLTGTVWELQQIQYNDDTLVEPTDPSRYTIEFFEDGNVSVLADCNVVRGMYDTAEDADFITLGASTLAACPPDSIDSEFKRNLEDAALYFFQDGNLYMDLPYDAGTMMFTPAAETTAVEEESQVVVEEETEVVEETAPEETPETTTEAEPVRGLW